MWSSEINFKNALFFLAFIKTEKKSLSSHFVALSQSASESLCCNSTITGIRCDCGEMPLGVI